MFMACVLVCCLPPLPASAVTLESSPEQEESDEFDPSLFDVIGGRWGRFAPFVSVMGGMGLAYKEYGDNWTLYSIWGPMFSGQAGFMIPMGFRVAASLTTMPYVQGDDGYSGTYFSATTLSARLGWGIWISSVYFGLQAGVGGIFRVFDDIRPDANGDKIGQNLAFIEGGEIAVVIDWHVSDDGFFVCEATLHNFFGGVMCGYGWEF